MVVSYLAIFTIITRVFFSIFWYKKFSKYPPPKKLKSQINFLQNPFFSPKKKEKNVKTKYWSWPI
jgi:hypothetical protein